MKLISYPFLNLLMIIIGPKDSSLAMVMVSSTWLNIVGSKKYPGLSNLRPPHSSLAPSLLPGEEED